MDRETIAFGTPVVGLLLTLLLIAVGLFQGGLTPLTYLGFALGMLSILVLVGSVTAVD